MTLYPLQPRPPRHRALPCALHALPMTTMTMWPDWSLACMTGGQPTHRVWSALIIMNGLGLLGAVPQESSAVARLPELKDTQPLWKWLLFIALSL